MLSMTKYSSSTPIASLTLSKRFDKHRDPSYSFSILRLVPSPLISLLSFLVLKVLRVHVMGEGVRITQSYTHPVIEISGTNPLESKPSPLSS